MENNIDGNYLATHGLKVIAGSSFSGTLKEDIGRNHVVVDEQFLKALNLGPAQQAELDNRYGIKMI